MAEQALNTANTALAEIQTLQAQQKQTRSTTPQAIPSGDSNFVYSFAPAMPDTNYEILLTLYAGAVGHPSAYYGVRVLESSIITTGFTVLIDNAPANSKLGIFIQQR